MKTPRWLWPFTFGVDLVAIDSVVRLAERAGATLVPVSLVYCPSQGARLEHIQQSKDFLEAVKFKAARYQVAVERFEVFTGDMLQSLQTLVHDLNCESLVLVISGKHPCFMQEQELRQLVLNAPAPLVLMRLPGHSRTIWKRRLEAGFRSWLQDRRGPQTAPLEEKILGSGTSQPHVAEPSSLEERRR